jgi:hypothetical protein
MIVNIIGTTRTNGFYKSSFPWPRSIKSAIDAVGDILANEEKVNGTEFISVTIVIQTH